MDIQSHNPAVKTWVGIYDCQARRSLEHTHVVDMAAGLQTPLGCPEWKCYMLEIVSGFVPDPRGVLLTTEGAKVCVPMLFVVPATHPTQATFTSLIHFGCYEPYFENEPKFGVPSTKFTSGIDYYLSAVNAYLQMVVPTLERATAIARERWTKATVIIALGTKSDHGTVIQRFLDEQMNTEPYKTWVNVVYHASFGESFTPAEGGNGIFHAHVSPTGQVHMLVSSARYLCDRGYHAYQRMSRNKNEQSPDGTLMPGCARDLLKLRPAFQKFLHLDMNITPNPTTVRQLFLGCLTANSRICMQTTPITRMVTSPTQATLESSDSEDDHFSIPAYAV